MKILLIEDEEFLAMLTESILKEEGHQVEVADNGADGLQIALMGLHDVILLDVNMPGMDGFEVLNRIRKEKIQTPVMMLTANSRMQDKVKGLTSGADDYVTKPYNREELLARIGIIARRNVTAIQNNTFSIASVEFNPKMLTLTSPVAEEHLPLKEAQILELLLKKEGVPLALEYFIERIWDYEEFDYVSDDLVRKHISRLRKKLKELDAAIEIKVVRKIGYLLQVK